MKRKRKEEVEGKGREGKAGSKCMHIEVKQSPVSGLDKLEHRKQRGLGKSDKS